MLNHYFRNVAPQVDVGFKPVKVEIKFEVPIYHPDTGEQLHCKCNECRGKYRKKFEEDPPEGWQGLPVTYAGRIDMLAEDDHGDYWIFDWKTAATLRDNDEFLYLDDQITSYCMALSLQLDLPIRGFVYVEMRKAFPQPPKENVHIRKGCKFSVSKSQATDYDTYLTHVSKHDTKAFNAGYYDDFLDWLKAEGPIFTRRYQIRKTRTELLNNMVQLGEEALDMTDPNLRVYPNSGRFSCSFCAFRQPCMGKNNGEDYEYTLDTMFDKLEHYYIRQEASTDTKGAE